LHELIDSELLLPDLGIRITGADSFATLLDKLSEIGEAARLVPLVQALAQLPQDATQAGWAQGLDALVADITGQKQFEVERKNVFQVDTKRMADITLSQEMSQKIADACQLLAQLTMRRIGYLDDFKRRFSERFEEREVPLDWLFNDEIGIPFPKIGKPISDLLSGIEFPATRGELKEEVKWDVLDRLMFRKYEQALRDGAGVIELTAGDVQEVASSKSGIKPSAGGMFAVASLFALDAAAQTEQQTEQKTEQQARQAETQSSDPGAATPGGEQYGVYLQSVGGRTGVEMLGRFCDLDPALTEQVRAIIGQIDQNDEHTIYAEVVHLPQDRIVNVVARPVMSEYEIPYLGKGGVPHERQILVSDLMVSLQNNRFVLRSRRLNKQVIPRLTSAHNYGGNNLNIYHFLCSQTWQDQPGISFDWSPVFRAALYLPRVCINGVVLSLATWRLDKAALADLRSALGQGRAALQAWRNARKMPRFISYDVFDNVLPVDLDNELMVQMLLDEIDKQTWIEVKEALSLNAVGSAADPDAAKGGTTGGAGGVPSGGVPSGGATSCNPAQRLARNIELVIPFRVEPPKSEAATPRELRQAASTLDPAHMAAPYAFLPGSEWTYFKIYCGQSQVDELLVRYVAPLMREQMAQHAIESWFFIRYADPEHHLRLRAKSASPQAAMVLGLALSQLCQRALGAGLGWRVVVDSYEREVTRYGGLQAIEHCERLFHLDSELVLDFIQSADSQIPVSQRWLFAVFRVTHLLDAFYPDQTEKADLIRSMAESFRAEFNFGARQKVQLGSKYRSYRADLDKLVFGRNSDAASEQQRTTWQGLIARHAPQVAQQVAAILQLQQQGQLDASLATVVRSLVHMHCNRLFIANQRAHEVVFYDFLDRIEGSLQAAVRNKAGASPGSVQ
jgi:thiopeptide-type bacteriocin biosynthesis protein